MVHNITRITYLVLSTTCKFQTKFEKKNEKKTCIRHLTFLFLSDYFSSNFIYTRLLFFKNYLWWMLKNVEVDVISISYPMAKKNVKNGKKWKRRLNKKKELIFKKIILDNIKQNICKILVGDRGEVVILNRIFKIPIQHLSYKLRKSTQINLIFN